MKPHHWILLSALEFGVAITEARADTWPARPIRAVIPVGAGSTTDIIPRIVFEQLSAALGHRIVVENRPGAGTTIGVASVAKADPDGYTWLVNSNAQTIAPSLYSNLTYDAAKDFAAVVPLGVSPNVLVVSPSKVIQDDRRSRLGSQKHVPEP